MNSKLYREAISKGETHLFHLAKGEYNNGTPLREHIAAINFYSVFQYGIEDGFATMISRITNEFCEILVEDNIDKDGFFNLVDFFLTYYMCKENWTDKKMLSWEIDGDLKELLSINYNRLVQHNDMFLANYMNDRMKCYYNVDLLGIPDSEFLKPISMLPSFENALKLHDWNALCACIQQFPGIRNVPYVDYWVDANKPAEEIIYYLYAMVKGGMIEADDIYQTFLKIKTNNKNVFIVNRLVKAYSGLFNVSSIPQVYRIKIRPILEEIVEGIKSHRYSNCDKVSLDMPALYEDQDKF